MWHLKFFCWIWVVALLLNGHSASAQARYSNGLPSEPSFFPIGVWLQNPANAPRYQPLDINTFVGLWKGPTESQLALLAKYGMFAIAAQNEISLASPNRGVIRGWLQDDEPDNAQPIGFGLHGTCIPAAEVVRRTRKLKSVDPSRPVMINFGQGIANEFWHGRGPCTGDQAYYSVAVEDADILSMDIYPVGSDIPQVKGRLEYVGRGVTNLVRRATSDQSVWAVLETTGTITPAQVRSEVWMAIIHGAKGIVYFVHEFAPLFREDGIFRRPDVVQEVARNNALIKALAIPLNGPSLAGKLNVQSDSTIATLFKEFQGKFYLFAVGMKNSTARARFTLEGIDQTQVVVIGENRTLLMSQGTFEDSFDKYGVHIYEISKH